MAATARPRFTERHLVLAPEDTPPDHPGKVKIQLNKYDFHKVRKEDSVNPLPEEVVKAVHEAAERRLMALGSYYKYLQLQEGDIKDVEAEIRKAKHYELLVTARQNAHAEFDALRELINEAEDHDRETRQRVLVEAQLLRQKAFKILNREAEFFRNEEQMRLEEDRKSILMRERNVLLERRRIFEHSNAGADTDETNSSADRSTAGAAPVLVMNVALGNGKEEKIVVRRHDDPDYVATHFVKKHHLPDHTVVALANQIRANLTHHVKATTGRITPGATTPLRRGAKSPVASSRR